MLEMYGLPGGDVCQIHGKKFVNDRLIGLMDDLISEYAIMSSANRVDHEAFRQDENFVFECMETYGLVPSTIGPRQALHAFWSLYDLLKAKKEYKPDLLMQYVLHAIIGREKDFCTDMPEIHQLRKRIPEPVRSEMMKELTEEAEGYKEGEPELYTESVGEIAEDLMGYYEDLEKYSTVCFEDEDDFFLDKMDDVAMEASGLAGFLGVDFAGDTRQMRIENADGDAVEFDISPWEIEDE